MVGPCRAGRWDRRPGPPGGSRIDGGASTPYSDYRHDPTRATVSPKMRNFRPPETLNTRLFMGMLRLTILPAATKIDADYKAVESIPLSEVKEKKP